MKALLAAHGTAYPFTHVLEVLMKLLAAQNEIMPAMPFNLLRLEPFAVELRYDAGNGLSPEERTAIAESVAILREHILTRILELEATP